MNSYHSTGLPCNSTMQQHAWCRHGARTPLTQRYWQTWGATWPDCQDKADAVRLAISAADGGPQPASAHDKAQVSQHEALKVYSCLHPLQHADRCVLNHLRRHQQRRSLLSAPAGVLPGMGAAK